MLKTRLHYHQLLLAPNIVLHGKYGPLNDTTGCKHLDPLFSKPMDVLDIPMEIPRVSSNWTFFHWIFDVY